MMEAFWTAVGLVICAALLWQLLRVLRRYPPMLRRLADELCWWWLTRRRTKSGSRITIGSNPEPFTIVDKTDSTIRVDRHDPNLKDGDIIVPYEERW